MRETEAERSGWVHGGHVGGLRREGVLQCGGRSGWTT